MIETYKLMSGIYDKAVTHFRPKQEESSTSLPTKGHSFKIYRQRAERKLKQNFLSICVGNQWNSLPVNIVETPAMKIFERRLNLYWKKHDLIHKLEEM